MDQKISRPPEGAATLYYEIVLDDLFPMLRRTHYILDSLCFKWGPLSDWNPSTTPLITIGSLDSAAAAAADDSKAAKPEADPVPEAEEEPGVQEPDPKRARLE